MSRGAKRRRVPVTSTSHTRPNASAKPEASRAIIRRYHVLLKRKTQLQKAAASSQAAKELEEVQEEMDGIGIEAYQHMSNIGQGSDRGGGSERVFLDYLRSAGVDKRHLVADIKMKLLEVGALRPDNYSHAAKWVEVTPIDLHARVPGIVEQDFFQMDDSQNIAKWDAISLSLVLNFVADAHERGTMLRKCHAFLVPRGHLFVALPLPCVQNSRYLTISHFIQLASALGLRCDNERWVDGRKMVYFIFSKQAVPTPSTEGVNSALFTKKRVLVEGGKRNNFCVLL
ncbi:putative methyltransferase-domain-containing protein [Auriculariales sp. MPI-PUGE-AT-0066]|nr:putative methyltransferase-domain-containing protein [Auriculariales sp. MPI-PUGE-AT-0066]